MTFPFSSRPKGRSVNSLRLAISQCRSDDDLVKVATELSCHPTILQGSVEHDWLAANLAEVELLLSEGRLPEDITKDRLTEAEAMAEADWMGT